MTSAIWRYQHQDTTSYAPSTMITKADNLDAQVSDMVHQGFVIYAITIEDFCPECQGDGVVRRKNTKSPYATKTCPACKGHKGPMATREYPV